MVETPHVRASGREAHRLVLERGLEVRRRLVPLGLPVDLHVVTVGRHERVRWSMSEVTVRPSLPEPGLLDDAYTILQRLGARRAKREMAHARHFRRRQLERVVLVVVPAAQIDGVALAYRL